MEAVTFCGETGSRDGATKEGQSFSATWSLTLLLLHNIARRLELSEIAVTHCKLASLHLDAVDSPHGRHLDASHEAVLAALGWLPPDGQADARLIAFLLRIPEAEAARLLEKGRYFRGWRGSKGYSGEFSIL